MRLKGSNLHKGLAVFLEDGECSVNVCHYYSVLRGVLCPREGGRQSLKPPSLCHQSLPGSGLRIHSCTLSQPSQIPAQPDPSCRVHPDRAGWKHWGRCWRVRDWVRRVRWTRKARNKGRGDFGQSQQGSLQI